MEKSTSTGIIAETMPRTRSTKVSDLHHWRSLQADLSLSNLARHKAHEALLALLELQEHHQQYSKAFRHAMRCVYRLRHLQEETRAWPVDPYPTARKLRLRYVCRTVYSRGHSDYHAN